MSGSSQGHWNRDSDAPQNHPQGDTFEKGKLFGNLSCAVLYGVVIALFFKCIGALLSPTNRTRGGFRWILMTHTVAMFFFATIYFAVNLNLLSTAYIDNREFPGINVVPPGPLGYMYNSYNNASGVVSTVMFLLNNWLADGLLLYRCYVVYAMNPWAVAFPCVIYLGTFAAGIALVYQQVSQPSVPVWHSKGINVGVSYSISVSLDALLTAMIIARLVMLSRELQKAMNAPFRLSGLYKAVITVVSESSALYAVSFLLFIGTWAAEDPAEYFFFPVLSQTQVIAPFLIVLRVANRTVLANDIISGNITSTSSSRRESAGGGRCTLRGSESASSMGIDGETPKELGVEVMMMVDLDHDKSGGSFKT